MRYYSDQHFLKFYLQDGGENQLGTKIRYCHPMYILVISVRPIIMSTSTGPIFTKFAGLVEL